ncbi:MAG: hypothetical protein KF916_00950 [Microbacteriaceae bacterium]|nr:hypothetical protein [Microbacteriaceae bacterium]
MNPEALTGGLVIAASAALWIIYLLPGWIKKREYNTTERNAVRLSQTLRIMAETSEVPEAVKAEISARSAKLLAAEHAAKERYAAAEVQMQVQRDSVRGYVRVGKLISATALLLGIAFIIFGFSTQAWSVVYAAGIVTILGAYSLRALNKRPVASTQTISRQSLREYAVAESVEEVPAPVVRRVQNTVPKPLYLSRETVVNKRADEEILKLARAALADAGRESEQKLRETQAAVPVAAPRIPQPPRQVSAKISGGIASSLEIIESAAESDKAVLNRLDQILKNRKVS